MANDKQNGPIRRTAFVVGSADGTSSIEITNVGGVLYATYPSGAMVSLGGGVQAVQVLAADLVVTSSLAAYVYDNGTDGVGATLTANAVGVFGAQDSVTSALNYVYLIPPTAVADAAYAGLYVLTTRGAPATTKAVLTRSAEFDSPEDMKDGTLFEIRLGTLYGNKGPWQLTGDVATVGTDAVTITRAPNLMLLDTAQTVTGPKTYAVATLKVANAAGTQAHTLASNASAARTVTLPDADGGALLDSGNLALTKETAHTIAVAASTTSGAAGGALTVAAAAGAPADALSAGATGGAYTSSSGPGGAAGAANPAGNSGVATYGSATGGAGSGTQAAGASGTTYFKSGDAGADGGGGGANSGDAHLDAGAPTGAGTAGKAKVGATNASEVELGRAAIQTTVKGAAVFEGAIDAGTHKIANVVDPTLVQDAATKGYVDTLGGTLGAVAKRTVTLTPGTKASLIFLGGNLAALTFGSDIVGALTPDIAVTDDATTPPTLTGAGTDHLEIHFKAADAACTDTAVQALFAGGIATAGAEKIYCSGAPGGLTLQVGDAAVATPLAGGAAGDLNFAAASHTFNVGAVTPAGARLLAREITNAVALATSGPGGAVTSSCTIGSSGTAVNAVQGATNLDGSLSSSEAAGLGPGPSATGITLNYAADQFTVTITAAGGNLNQIDAGAVTVRLDVYPLA